MAESADLREAWRAMWLGSIQEFADADTQHRLWLDPANENPHFSFVEYFCSYFDDLGLSDVNGLPREQYRRHVEQGVVTLEEVDAVAEFHLVAGAYESPTHDYDHKAIPADPKWDEVVAAARRAQSNLLGLIHDPVERRQLTQP